MNKCNNQQKQIVHRIHVHSGIHTFSICVLPFLFMAWGARNLGLNIPEHSQKEAGRWGGV